MRGRRNKANGAITFAAAIMIGRIAIKPANSPWAPEFGCRETASYPLIAQSRSRRSWNMA